MENKYKISSDAKKSGFSTTASTSCKKRLPSKSVRLAKRDAHKAHVNKYTVKKLNARLDEKRLLSDEDLDAVFEEMAEIAAREPSKHTDECRYYMNCHGHDCSCDAMSLENVTAEPVDIQVDNPMIDVIVEKLVEKYPVDDPENDCRMMKAMIDEAVSLRVNVVQGCLTDKLHDGKIEKPENLDDDKRRYNVCFVPREVKVLVGQLGLVKIDQKIFYPITTFSGRTRMSAQGRNWSLKCWKERLEEKYRLFPLINSVQGSRSMLATISKHDPPLSDYEKSSILHYSVSDYVFCKNPFTDKILHHRLAIMCGWKYKSTNLEFEPDHYVDFDEVGDLFKHLDGLLVFGI